MRLRDLNHNHAGHIATIDGHTGTLSWAQNPSYMRITVEHWWLIIPTHRFPNGAAMSLQWASSSTPVALHPNEVAA